MKIQRLRLAAIAIEIVYTLYSLDWIFVTAQFQLKNKVDVTHNAKQLFHQQID